jgi:diguanylate cyclase (GGDEF)-like protein
MEILLYLWSIGVQCTSLAMITVFFAVLARSTRRVELRSWVFAWCADLLALGISLLYWLWQPTGVAFHLVVGAYMATKTAFVLLFIDGAWLFQRPERRLLTPARGVAAAVLYSLTCVLISRIELLGVVQNLVMAALFALGGWLTLRRPRPAGLSWLGAALLIRAFISVVECAVYFFVLSPADTVPAAVLSTARAFLSAHSFIDTGAEWLLALACVLALSDRVQTELLRYNRELLSAQDELRLLAERDPLTGLANRRSLPEILSGVRDRGALLLFFDLDGFKALNDGYGHAFGDECLQRFANCLRECFRATDALVRYAGDEFLVVAPDADRASAAERIEHLRDRLRFAALDGPRIEFSVGIAELPPGGEPDAALARADQSMYRAKAAARG